MAVITKYIIVRNGIELDKVFEDKKEADAYDKMLDAAEELADFIKTGDLPVDLEEALVDDIAIYLAKNAPEVTRILKGIKPIVPRVKTATDTKTAVEQDRSAPGVDKKTSGRKPGAKSKDQ